MTQTHGIRYANHAGLDLFFDFFRSEMDEPLPLIVLIHGGGWISGDRTDMHDVAASFAEDGFAAATVEYRLAPLYPFPAPLEDIAALVSFVRQNANGLGINPDQIGALGNSAGGHLAAMSGLNSWLPNSDSVVNAVVDICGISDIRNPREKHLPISWGFVEQFMGGVSFASNEGLYTNASPISHISSSAPPFLIFHGEDDEVVPVTQSIELHAALGAKNVNSELVIFPGEGHSFTYETWIAIENMSKTFFKKVFQLD